MLLEDRRTSAREIYMTGKKWRNFQMEFWKVQKCFLNQLFGYGFREWEKAKWNTMHSIHYIE